MKKIVKKNTFTYQLGDYEIAIDRNGNYDVSRYSRIMSIWKYEMTIGKNDLKYALELLKYIVEDSQ